MRKTFTAIVLPALFTVLISVMIFPWACHQAGFTESIKTANYRAILSALLSWKLNSLPGSSHLWYITDYCRLMLIFPLLSYLCCEDENARIARRMLYVLYAAAVLYTDLRQLFPQIPAVFTYTMIDSRSMFFLLGYEFSVIHKKHPGLAVPGALIAGAGCIMMWLMTKLKFALTGELSDFFFHYQTIPCLIASAGAFACFISLPLEKLPQTAARGIYFLGKQTWAVYLIHLLPLNFLRSLPGGNRPDLPYLLQLTVMTVVCSFAAATILNFVCGAARKLLRPAQP